MLPLLVAATLVSAGPPKIAQAELRGANMPHDTLAFFSEHLAGQLRSFGVSMVTASEISTLLGLERQKELIGCADSGCVAELANALGVEGVLVGDIGHFGDIFQVELKILAADGGGVLASYTARVGSEQAALDTLDVGARELSRGLHQKLHRPVPDSVLAAVVTAPPPSSPRSVRSLSWIPLAGGVVFAAAGVGLLLAGQSAHYQLLGDPNTLTDEQGRSLAANGNLEQWLGLAAIGVGSAAVIAAGCMFLFGGAPTASLSIAPTSGGAALSFGGALP